MLKTDHLVIGIVIILVVLAFILTFVIWKGPCASCGAAPCSSAGGVCVNECNVAGAAYSPNTDYECFTNSQICCIPLETE
ncbi:MAG: hypothetical protein KKF46_05180 [Nanoarchaeota archaeon]|nr:hypothetical protein [Nanoarchaeota archaeon]MBU1321726.1 hypothetical protein [Nanoarchaeota archaeon]MBU1597692.1 hypothetical protein [Nanoarchaeota archaeon]MBU2440746.1 hypothetical protein [Nanoarchaeota archaeon]